MKNVKIISCGKRTMSGVKYSVTNLPNKNCYCILYVPQGKGVAAFNNTEVRLKPDDLIICTPQDTLTYCFSKKHKLTFYFAEFMLEDETGFFNDYKLEKGILHCYAEKETRTAFAFLINEFIVKSEFYDIRINAYFAQLMCTLSQSCRKQAPCFKEICELAKEINNNLQSSNIDVTPHANALNLSKDRFSVLFKKHFGNPPHQYHIMLKMNEADFLLHHSDFSIGEISKHLGFSNQLYFSSAYKKYKGESPTQARKKYR